MSCFQPPPHLSHYGRVVEPVHRSQSQLYHTIPMSLSWSNHLCESTLLSTRPSAAAAKNKQQQRSPPVNNSVNNHQKLSLGHALLQKTSSKQQLDVQHHKSPLNQNHHKNSPSSTSTSTTAAEKGSSWLLNALHSGKERFAAKRRGKRSKSVGASHHDNNLRVSTTMATLATSTKMNNKMLLGVPLPSTAADFNSSSSSRIINGKCPPGPKRSATIMMMTGGGGNGFRTPQRSAFQRCSKQAIDADFLAFAEKDYPVLNDDSMFRRLEKLGEGRSVYFLEFINTNSNKFISVMQPWSRVKTAWTGRLLR